ncbi:uncharacterized protein METZ01_LOCUS230925, partial [marine metagenome]
VKRVVALVVVLVVSACGDRPATTAPVATSSVAPTTTQAPTATAPRATVEPATTQASITTVPTATTTATGSKYLGSYTLVDEEFGTMVTVAVDGSIRTIDSNALPDHETGDFPNNGNPNT